MKNRSRFSWLLPLVMVLCASFHHETADAAMIEQTLDELCDSSTAIVEGKVVAKEASWDSERTFIFTTATLTVNETFKGAFGPADTIHLLIPGGEIDGVGLKVEHAAEVEVGEEVIIFLKPVGDSLYGVTAWEQGRYTVADGTVKEKGISVKEFTDSIKKVLERRSAEDPEE